MVYYRILNMVLYAIQYNLIYPFYIQKLHLLIPASHSNTPPLPVAPLATTSLFSMSLILFLFHRWIYLHHVLILRISDGQGSLACLKELDITERLN